MTTGMDGQVDPDVIREQLLGLIQRMLGPEILAAASRAKEDGCPEAAGNHASEQVAYALAWLMTRPRTESTGRTNATSMTLAALAAECGDGSADLLRETYTQEFRPTGLNPRSSSPLQELAWSVACEARRDWHKEPSRLIRGHAASVTVVCFSPDGTRVLTASKDRTVRIWDTESADLQCVLRIHEGRISGASFSADGKQVVTASHDAGVRVWDAGTGAILSTLDGHDGGTTTASFSPSIGETRILTAGRDGRARIRDARTGRTVVELGTDSSEIIQAGFSREGVRIITVHQGGPLRVWDLTPSGPVQETRIHTGPVRSASFAPDGGRIMAVHPDGVIRIWETVTGELVRAIEGHPHRILSASFSSDGSRIVTASDDRIVRILDESTGEQLHVIEGHAGAVRSACFSPDGRWIATASDDRTARIWDATTCERVHVLDGLDTTPVFAAFHAMDQHAVIKSVQKCRAIGIEPEDVAAQAWAIAWEKYWSADARDRFAGLSKASTLVTGIAKFVALRAMRERGDGRAAAGNESEDQ